MPAQTGLQIRQLGSSIRFVRGYRFLDRCGEALIRLEESLDQGWIPFEQAPTGGGMRNDTLGMSLRFNSEHMSVQQEDFTSFDLFLDQACKAFDVVRSAFGVETINAPSLQAIYQRGFEHSDDADAFLRALRLTQPNDKVLAAMEGTAGAVTFTLCTTRQIEWHGIPIEERRRLEASSVIQVRQPPFDMRLAKRVKLLPSAQRDAMQALMRIRSMMPEVKPAAAQFDLENAFENEFDVRDFDLPAFYHDSWTWIERMAEMISGFAPKS